LPVWNFYAVGVIGLKAAVLPRIHNGWENRSACLWGPDMDVWSRIRCLCKVVIEWTCE
jgi:hypothetical protein